MEYRTSKSKPKAGVNFSLLGGEPFFTEHMYKFLEEFILQIHDDIPEGYKFVVTVTTNMNFPQNKFDRFIELVKKTPKVIYDMQLSGEAVGRKSELVRWGQDFNKWNENLAQFMNVTKSIDNIYIGLVVRIIVYHFHISKNSYRILKTLQNNATLKRQ